MTTSYRPVVRSQSELQSVWTQLMSAHTGDRGFRGQSLWLLVIDGDDRPLPQLTEISDATEPPDDDMVSSVARFLEGLAGTSDDGRRFAFLRSRPGHGGLTAEDLAWARSLYAAGRLAGVPLEVVHRACDHDVVAVSMDDALGA